MTEPRSPRTPLVTCLGEILVDFLPLERDGRTIGFTIHPGGSLLNVAVAVVRLGGRAAMVSRAGRDTFGRSLRAHLAAEGVDTRWLPEAAAPTTLGFVTVEQGEPGYTFYGEGAADTLLTPADLVPALLSETDILHVGSISLLRGSTPTAALTACEQLKGRALLSLDPNVRPGLVRDEAAYRALLDRLFGLVDLLKISAADLAWLFPGRDVVSLATELLDRGPALVVITRGAAGVLAAHRRDGGVTSVELPAFDVTVVDTVGAGDTYDGALLVRLAELGITSRPALEALDLDQLTAVLRFAAAAAALDCARAGADPPRRADVESLLAAPAGASR